MQTEIHYVQSGQIEIDVLEVTEPFQLKGPFLFLTTEDSQVYYNLNDIVKIVEEKSRIEKVDLLQQVGHPRV